MAELCDICGVRPASVRVRVTRNGESEVLNVCEVDYRTLAARQRGSSPMESLFGRRGSLFDEMFGNDAFFGGGGGSIGGGGLGRGASDPDGGGGQVPVGGSGRRGTAPRAGEFEDRLSEHAKDLLQTAARRASEYGRREVDTEHLMMALLDSDVVRTVLQQFGVQPD
ncbi:MAG: Clp protease ClpC [Phenylobacterium sp.]|nr:Clp protease ClpC [Phenylobacterium sp.]